MAEQPSFIPTLAEFLVTRAQNAPEGSYSHSVINDSVLARRKIMEEAFEVCLELGASPVERDRLAEEVADVVFHLLCATTGAGLAWGEVEAVLRARHEGASS